MKSVSVIVPVYNSQDYLVECAESLVHQTLQDIEIIFVNDGSTDDSLRILEEYREKFPDKVIIETKDNGGQATARNQGLRIARGQYIGFVDSDDYVDVNMFQAMYEQAIATDSDLVECDYKYLQILQGGEVKELENYGYVREYKDDKDMFINPLVSPWNKIYRASVLKDNDVFFTEGYIYEDTAFFIKGIPYVKKSTYLNKKYVYHFLRSNSTMNAKKDLRVGNIFPVLEDIITFYIENGFAEKYWKELEYFCVKILLCSSLNRIATVTDKEIRNRFMQMTQNMIYSYFKSYRTNSYFKEGMTGLYMRCMNPITIRIMVMLLRLKEKK